MIDIIYCPLLPYSPFCFYSLSLYLLLLLLLQERWEQLDIITDNFPITSKDPNEQLLSIHFSHNESCLLQQQQQDKQEQHLQQIESHLSSQLLVLTSSQSIYFYRYTIQSFGNIVVLDEEEQRQQQQEGGQQKLKQPQHMDAMPVQIGFELVQTMDVRTRYFIL